MKDENLSTWEKITRFVTVAYEVWKSSIQLILFFFVLGITSGVAGFSIKNAPILVFGIGVFTITGIIVIYLSALANELARFEVKVRRKYVTYKYFPDNIFRSIIPRTVRLAEAPSYGQSILLYDPKGKGAKAYMRLATEFIDRQEKIY